ncbi:MAG TPA: hypothetical protein VFM01_09385 [Nakamurella sp.]|nr:hypothetical protein [Nakamurella sp.]
MHKKQAWLALVFASSLVLAACGSNSGNESSSTTPPATTGGGASSSAPMESSSGGASSSESGSGSASGSASASAPASSSEGESSSSSAPPANPLPNTGKPIDIMGWTTGDEVGTSRADYVKQQDSSLDIKVDQNGFDQQKFATAMASGTVPAGVNMDRQLLATYAAKGFLEPLDDCISSNGIDMSQYYPEAVKESTWDGHVYGIPEFYTTRGVYINNNVLKDAGLTADDVDTSDWNAVSELAKKLYKESGGKPSTIGFDPKVPEFLPLWVMADGGNIVDDTGQPTLNDPKVVEALTWAVSVINEQGGWANFKSFRDTWDFFGADNEFAKNQIGVMPYEQWYANVLAGFGDKVNFSVIPFKAKDGSPLTFESGSAFAIPKGSPNAGGMCQFMKLVTSQDAWAAAGAAREAKVEKDKSVFTGIFSANKPANEAMRAKYVKPSSNPALDQAIGVFYDSLDYAKMIPPSPAGQQIQQAYQQAVTDALGGKDPKAALDAAQQTAMTAFQDATG